MSKVLLIEDSPEIMEIAKAALRPVEIICATTLAQAEHLLVKHRYDLILLDVTLPDGDGMRFYTKLHSIENAAQTPVIFLTGKGELSDKLIAFSLGAEDYIVKPFDPLELQARVKANLKKTKRVRSQEEQLRIGSLVLNLGRQSLHIVESGLERRVELAPIEFKLIAMFIRNAERVLSRERLIEEVWGDGIRVLDRTVDSHVSSLRQKLQGTSHMINVIYGTGYTLSPAKTRTAKKKKSA